MPEYRIEINLGDGQWASPARLVGNLKTQAFLGKDREIAQLLVCDPVGRVVLVSSDISWLEAGALARKIMGFITGECKLDLQPLESG